MAVIDKWLAIPPPPLSAAHAETMRTLAPFVIPPFRECEREVRPLIVHNRVYRVDTAASVPFLTLMAAIRNYRRRRVKFAALRVPYGTAGGGWVTTMMLYNSGRAMVSGTRTEIAAVRALQLFRLDMNQTGVIPIGLARFTLVNEVVKLFMPFPVDIVAAHESGQLPMSLFYQDDFPGLMLTVHGVKVLVFYNGRCVLTGTRDDVEMETVRGILLELLAPFKPKEEQSARGRSRARRSTAAKSILKKPAQDAEQKPENKPSRRRKRAVVRIEPVANTKGRKRSVSFMVAPSIVLPGGRSGV